MEPISIAWRNLSFYKTSFFEWKHFGRRQTILQDLHGSFHLHSLNGVLGCSGAGKTTLLKALSRSGGLSPETEIFTRPSPNQPVSYFIEQHIHETIHSELTVREVFTYAYQFKNGIQSTADQMGSHIDSVIVQLLLKPEVLDRRFGQLSGGEMRRVVIGQELMGLQSPDFMFCDELTTGLDSYAALEVIRCLSSLASANSQLTVIISIHAPSNELLEYFSQLFVLAKGGKAVYSGPPKELPTFLKQILPNYDAEQNEEQPIETLIRFSSEEGQNLNATFIDRTASSELSKIDSQLSSLSRNVLPSNYKSYSLTDQYLLLRRQLAFTFIAQLHVFLAQLGIFTTGMVLISFLFSSQMTIPDGCLKTGHKGANFTNQTSYQPTFAETMLTYENLNYIYYYRLFQGFAFTILGAANFHFQVSVFRNEHRNRWYSSTVFYLSNLLTNILSLVVYTVVFSNVVYFIVAEHAIDNYTVNWRRLLAYHLLTWLKMIYGYSLGEAVSLVVVDYQKSIIFASFLFAGHMTTDNFFVRTDELASPVARLGADIFGMKYFVKYLVYIFYGLDRCEGEGDVSWLLVDFYVDRSQVNYYVLRIVASIVALKLFTYAVVMAKFSIHWPTIELPFGKALVAHDQTELKKSSSAEYNGSHQVIINNSQEGIDYPNKNSNILLAFTNLTLHSKRFSLKIGSHQQNPPILRNLNGHFTAGSLYAVMGMSGAGKTSLLKVLNGQHASQLSPETAFYVSNKVSLGKVFIAQHVTDHLFSGLTAKQALVYASKLKNANETTKIDHNEVALKLLNEMAMPEVADRRVENLSGGEQKRLVIALELTSLKMPNLLCVDEPTSGLDSSTAEKVIAILKSFAKVHNIAIIASLHQPNSRLLNTFHQLFILSIGGVCIYFGEPSGIKEHLQSANIVVGKYPIETAIKVSCAGADDPFVQRLSKETTGYLSGAVLAKCTYPTESISPNRTRFSLYHTWILLCRYLTFIYAYQWIELAVLGLIVILYGVHTRSLTDVTQVAKPGCLSFDDDLTETGLLYNQFHPLLSTIKYSALISVFFVLILCIQSGVALASELPIFVAEHRNGWYSTGAFFLVKSAVDVLPLLPPLAIFTYIVDIYVDRPGLYPHLFLILLLSILIAQSTFYVFLLLCRCKVIVACIVLDVFYLINTLLCNVFIPLKGRPLLQLLSNVTLFRHTLEALLLRVYGFERCREREVQPILQFMELSDEDYGIILLKFVLNVFFWKGLALYLLVRKVNCDKRTAKKENERLAVVKYKI